MHGEASLNFEKLKKEAAVEEARLRELDEAIPRRRDEIEQLKDLIRQSPGGDTYLSIKTENQRLAAKIAQLKEIGTSLESVLAARVRAARTWAASVAKLPLELDAATVEAVESAAAKTEAGGLAQADERLRSLADAAQKAASEVSRAARPTFDRVTKLRQELGA